MYAVSVVYITQNFFPGEYGTILALSTFAFSFLIRPLGGLFWGPLGDRLGRKRILALTIILMAGATFCIGLLPTVETIGIAAPILLILLRAVQGFSTGGEYGGAATFMAEYAPDKRRGFLGSFLEFGTLAGFALGSLVVLAGEVVLGNQAMSEWGWRIPFLLAGPMGLIGLYLRSRLAETPIFEELEQTGKTEGNIWMELQDLVTRYWRPMLTMAGLVIALNVVNYTLLSYMPTYLEGQVGMANQTVLAIMFIAQFAMMLVIPFAGALSDRVGRKPMWYASLIGLFVPAFYMMLACVVGLIAVRSMKETVGASLRGTEIPETKPQDIVRARS